MRIRSIASATVLAMFLGGAALAEDGAALYAAKTCSACHGKDAKTPLMADYPKIAGQNAAYAEKQMLDIKSGVRSNGNSAAMKGVMSIVTEADIKVLAGYLSTLQP